MRFSVRLLASFAIPVLGFAHLSGTPSGVSGAPGEQTCAQCHSGPSNASRFTLNIPGTYTPGETQNITIEIDDLAAQDFGFQLTARLESDRTQPAGFFSATADSQVLCAGRCSTSLQYAAQTLASSAPSGAGKRIFSVRWVAPGRDLGPVHFYAAGVGGNGDKLPTGDQVFTQDLVANSRPCHSAGPPVIKAPGPLRAPVEDGAAFSATIGSSGLISIFGTGFADPGVLGIPSAPWYAYTPKDLVNGKWPTELACVQATVNGTPVPVFFVSATQINAQAPVFTNPNGEQPSVQVILNAGTPQEISSGGVLVTAQPIWPTLFTFNGTSAAALNGSKRNQPLADTSVVAGGVSAAPGDVILVYGTGFGPTNPAYATGVFASLPPAPLPRLMNPVIAMIGGVEVSGSDIQYAGLAFDAPGLYQFNVRVPDVPDNPQTPISIQIGGLRTQAGATIPVKR